MCHIKEGTLGLW